MVNFKGEARGRKCKMDVIIVGGSISGLLHGVMLKRRGHNVQIFEQSPGEPEHQAAGITTAPSFQAFLDRFDRNQSPFTLPCEGISTLNNSDEVVKFIKFDRTINSWDSIYYRLRWNFDEYLSNYYLDSPSPQQTSSPKSQARTQEGSAVYRGGQRLTAMEVLPDGGVTATFTDVQTGASDKVKADLLIGADGANSTVRNLVLDKSCPRKYAGYVLWRGVVEERELSDQSRALFEKHLTFLALKRQYLIAYHIPGANGSLRPGERLINLAWYTHQSSSELEDILRDRDGYRHHWSVPLGKFRDEVWAAQKQRGDETGLKSSAFRELIDAIAQPFLQVISDMSCPRAAFHDGRVLLVGDALTLLRPHTGKASSTAASHCLLLDKWLEGVLTTEEWESACLRMGLVDSLEAISWGHYYMSGWLPWSVAAVKYRIAWYWWQCVEWWKGVET